MLHETIRHDDFFAQYNIAMLEQCCHDLYQCRENVATKDDVTRDDSQ